MYGGKLFGGLKDRSNFILLVTLDSIFSRKCAWRKLEFPRAYMHTCLLINFVPLISQAAIRLLTSNYNNNKL